MIADPRIQEFLRYGMASAAALAVDFGLLVLLTSVFGVDYLISAAVGFSVGVVVVYILSITWVFRGRTNENRGSEFAVFVAIGIAGLGVNELIMWQGTETAGLPYQVSKLLSAGCVFLFNFTFRKLLLFSDLRIFRALRTGHP